jgi:hypothetical protein
VHTRGWGRVECAVVNVVGSGDRAVAAVAGSQRTIVTREQLIACDLGPKAIAHRSKKRRKSESPWPGKSSSRPDGSAAEPTQYPGWRWPASRRVPLAAPGPNRSYFGIGLRIPRNGSSVGRWLALRPEFSARARMPPTALSAPRGGRRGLLVLTAGPVRCLYRRYPTDPVVASPSDLNARAPGSSIRADQQRDGKDHEP